MVVIFLLLFNCFGGWGWGGWEREKGGCYYGFCSGLGLCVVLLMLRGLAMFLLYHSWHRWRLYCCLKLVYFGAGVLSLSFTPWIFVAKVNIRKFFFFHKKKRKNINSVNVGNSLSLNLHLNSWHCLKSWLNFELWWHMKSSLELNA